MPNLPLSLYIHIPWCIKKCPYCDFNSHPMRGELPEANYIDALLEDLDRDLAYVQDRPLMSIFFGGGTPSLFSAEGIHRLLTAIQSKVKFNSDIEITLEANPGTVEQNRFQGFREAGVNRLSIGCQSFQETKLKALGRIHGAKEAVLAIESAKNAGFDNFNIDLMYGLPNQKIEDALYDLNQAIALQPTHISWYQLTIEPNTAFHQYPPVLPMDDLIWDMQGQGQALLASQGYQQYEVSAYSQLGKQCQHNLNYWRFGDYLGIGAGAHAKLTRREDFTITRLIKHKHPKTYLLCGGRFVSHQETITTQAIPFEFMLNALRLNEPLSSDLYQEHTGKQFNTLNDYLKQAQQKGFIEYDQYRLQKTPLGERFLNDLLGLFLETAS